MFDHKNQVCAFAEQTVSFLYDELEAENRRAFDEHLRNCRACADEIQGFGAVRASVADWRALAFDPLATPKIEIDFEQETQAHRLAPAAKADRFRLDGLRKLFAFSPAFAYAAALILTVVCVGLIAYNFVDRLQIAAVEDKVKPAQATASTAQDNTNGAIASTDKVERDDKSTAEKTPLESNNSEVKNYSPQTAKERRTLKISTGVRVAKSETIAQKINRVPASRKSLLPNAVVAQNDLSAGERRAAPKLSAIEDEEDEDSSLRLSDLLGDAGGK